MSIALSPRARLCAALPLLVLTAPTVRAEPDALHYLTPTQVAPDHILAAPPAAGSPEERAELAEVRSIGQSATPERIAQARNDGEHEDPGVFADAAGRDLARLPATARLLGIVAEEAEGAAEIAKAHFVRARPAAIDPTLARCTTPKAKPSKARSYPSGHSTYAWSAAWTLAALIPGRAPQILSRAADFGFSREICGVHFPSDIEAGHVLGVIVASALLADPRLAPDVAAARAELSGN